MNRTQTALKMILIFYKLEDRFGFIGTINCLDNKVSVNKEVDKALRELNNNEIRLMKSLDYLIDKGLLDGNKSGAMSGGYMLTNAKLTPLAVEIIEGLDSKNTENINQFNITFNTNFSTNMNVESLLKTELGGLSIFDSLFKA